jgi:DNA-binding MarR family transcriptional regulator
MTLMSKQTEPPQVTASLGTQLSRLIELLDGDVEKHYVALGLNYRPRFTPIVRALEALGTSSIKSIAGQSGLSHSAVSQTVAQMVKHGLVVLRPGRDGRERIVEPTQALVQMVPVLHVQWAATNSAASKLETELSASLLQTISEAICALQRRSFSDRITDEAQQPGGP